MVALLTPFSLTGAFTDFNPVGAPTGGWKGNADTLGQWAMAAWLHQLDRRRRRRMASCGTTPASTPTAPWARTRRPCTRRLNLKFDLHDMPANLAIGARYEDTKVTATSQHPGAVSAAVAGRQ